MSFPKLAHSQWWMKSKWTIQREQWSWVQQILHLHTVVMDLDLFALTWCLCALLSRIIQNFDLFWSQRHLSKFVHLFLDDQRWWIQFVQIKTTLYKLWFFLHRCWIWSRKTLVGHSEVFLHTNKCFKTTKLSFLHKVKHVSQLLSDNRSFQVITWTSLSSQTSICNTTSPESSQPPESRPAQVPLTCSNCLHHWEIRLVLTNISCVILYRLNYLDSREDVYLPGGDSPSSREHRDTEETELDQNPNPGYRGSVNVVLKVWRWISVSEETL